jgi:hypothetical protein
MPRAGTSGRPGCPMRRARARRWRTTACAGGPARTWIFDGQWRALATASTPAPSRADAIALAYDAAHDRVVLFDAGGGATWLFDGTDWAAAPSLGQASATGRFGPAMAYDAARGAIVQFGVSENTDDGIASGNATREFDGAQWIDRAPAHSPRPRAQPAMIYDPARRRIVLFGGGPTNPDDGRADLADAWEYDGTDWTPRATVTAPPAQLRPALAYDAVRGRIVLAGADTWTLGFVSDVPAELCIAGVDTDGDGLAGCDDPDCAGLCTGCGDQVCNAALERAVCPADCGP